MSRALRQSHRRARQPRGKNIASQVTVEEVEAREERERRRQEALAVVRQEKERLERRIAREKVEPAVGATLGASYQPVTTFEEPAPQLLVEEPDIPPAARTLAIRFPDFPWEGDGNAPDAIGKARRMLASGYNIRKVVSTFGVGLKWLDDIPLDEMGFGLSRQH